jgi:hypothetical protein
VSNAAEIAHSADIRLLRQMRQIEHQADSLIVE